MSNYIEAANRLDAWCQATARLLSSPRHIELNLVLSIEDPLSNGPHSLEADRLVDAFLEEQGGYPTHTVAETIFPGSQYARNGIEGVFQTYPEEEYPLINDGWGRYAYRLVRRRGPGGQPLRDKDGDLVNPLERVIRKMKRQHEIKTTQRSVYEVGFSEPEDLLVEDAFDLPTFDTNKDIKLIRGQPCLSHVTMKLLDGKVHLTALYRSHCYVMKAYGNLLGLARLQACVAHEVGVEVGTMTILSSYAYAKNGLDDLKTLLVDLDQLDQ